MTGKQMKKLLEKNWWVLDRINGSHHIFIKDNKTIPVPIHGNKDLSKGTELAILKEAGFK